MFRFLLFILVCLNFSAAPLYGAKKAAIRVGSKAFTENYILAEILVQIIESVGEARVERKFGFTGTGLVYEAIKADEIDIYPEYSGTISRAILKRPELVAIDDIRKVMESQEGLTISDSLGFNNTYALAMPEDLAEKLKIQNISDLKKHPNLRMSITHEFDRRRDGWPGLVRNYGLRINNKILMNHGLAYEALDNREVDLIDAYTTDAKIKRYELRLLDDDKNFFPKYYAVFVAREGFARRYPKTWYAIKKMEKSLNESEMINLNAMSEIEKNSFSQVATYFLKNQVPPITTTSYSRLWKNTKEHVFLVFVSLFFSTLVGIPIGLWAFRSSKMEQFLLASTGLMQTIPSLALLCFLIPVFGTGAKPTLVALFLYSLLPIVRNTHTGFKSIGADLIESAKSLGLKSSRRLLKVELPLASRHILTGIKTSAIISVGTATIAAFIGAGGFGESIVVGLALNNMEKILEGAIPAALMALVIHALFELADHFIIPYGIRISERKK